jgi:hypothetical protein
MTRTIVALDWVYSHDTEDVTGPDEFYLLGGVSDGGNTAAILTKPVSINDRQRRKFGDGGGVVFDADVPDDRVLKVAFMAFDEDANHDWSNHGGDVQQLAGTLATGLKAIPNPYTAAAAVILPIAVGAIGGIMSLDQDDMLGSHSGDYPMWVVPEEPLVHIATIEGGGGWWSSWQYTVQYRVLKGKATDTV